MEEVAMDSSMELMDLNDNCLLTILQNVPISDMLAVSDTCQTLRRLAMKVMRTHYRNRWFIINDKSVKSDMKYLSRFFEVFKYMEIPSFISCEDDERSEFFEILKSNPPNLQKLNVRHKDDVAGVIRLFPNLLSLEISPIRIPNNKVLIDAIQSCTNLTELTLRSSPEFGEPFYETFFQSLELKNLKDLDLRHVANYKSVFQDLKLFLRVNPTVQWLSLDFRQASNRFLMCPRKVKLLLPDLWDLKELQTLKIVFDIDSFDAENLITKMGKWKWTNFRCLDLCVRNLCDIGLARAFSNFSNLVELRLQIRLLDPDEHFFATLCAGLNNLNTLVLDHEEMDEKDLIDIITNSEKLMNLDLETGDFNEVLTETTISSLVECQNRKNGVGPLKIRWATPTSKPIFPTELSNIYSSVFDCTQLVGKYF